MAASQKTTTKWKGDWSIAQWVLRRVHRKGNERKCDSCIASHRIFCDEQIAIKKWLHISAMAASQWNEKNVRLLYRKSLEKEKPCMKENTQNEKRCSPTGEKGPQKCTKIRTIRQLREAEIEKSGNWVIGVGHSHFWLFFFFSCARGSRHKRNRFWLK